MDASVQYLPQELTVEDIYRGEIVAPDLLKTFITYLTVGPDIKRNNLTTKQCRINSICQDIVYAASSGREKPAKHLQ